MNEKHDCQCPPKPSFAPGSLASGSATEEAAHARWEAQHAAHAQNKETDIQNPYEEMPMDALRSEITRLSEALDKHLTDAKKMLPSDPEDSARDAFSAWLSVSSARQTVYHLRAARGALAAKEDAEKVDRASAVLDILRKTHGFVDGEAQRLIMAARDYLRSVMGAK